jgi:hypothetical protein
MVIIVQHMWLITGVIQEMQLLGLKAMVLMLTLHVVNHVKVL